ncbi:LysR family transcriptional regulator [Nocardiopsis sp. CNT312]|uniref:LysR family transcriptional regulator n=1 Tax=Nocardiopsis sp. CNT312 TaxID=1137268 RepID=UPI00048BE42B|nr:LysR family transcriptional regulator [Nocardiopsis sp. CNT312]
MLDAHRLRVLVEVAHAGSIAAAAQRLSFTPPALSQQLTKLERETGCVLVERGRTGATLTEAGRVLLDYGERVLGELRDAETAVRAIAGEPPRRLSLGAFASAGKVLLPRTLAAFGHAHPHVRLSLSDIEPPGGYDLLTCAELDLLVTHRYPGVPLPRTGGLHRERVLVDPLMAVAPEGHPITDRSPSLVDLAGEEWICGAPGVHDRISLDTAAAAAGVRLNVVYETRDYEVALALIESGVGVALIPSSILGAARTGAWVSRPLHGARLAREIFAVHRRRPSEPVSAMVATLHETAARLTGSVPPAGSARSTGSAATGPGP